MATTPSLESQLAAAADILDSAAVIEYADSPVIDAASARQALHAVNAALGRVRLSISNAQRAIQAGTDPLGDLRRAHDVFVKARAVYDAAKATRVAAARAASESGASYPQIAEVIGTTKAYASKIVNGGE